MAEVCPVCGATDHETIKVLGMSIIGCPKLGRDDYWLINRKQWAEAIAAAEVALRTASAPCPPGTSPPQFPPARR